MKQNYFAAAARQISLACLIAMLYSLIILLNGTPVLFYPVTLIVYGLVICGADRLFAKRSRTLVQVVIFNVFCGVIYFALLLFTGTFPVFWQGAYGFFSILLLTVLGAAAAYSPVKLNSILLSMDANILLLVFSVLLIASLPHSFGWVAFAILGAVSGLLGALSYRLDRMPGKREWGVLLFLFLVIAVLAWLLFAFVVSPLSTGMADAGRSIAAFFVFLGGQIDRFFKFLARLLPEDDGTTAPDLQAASSAPGQNAEESGVTDNSLFPLLLIGVIAAAIVVALFLFLRRNRKSEISAMRLAARKDAQAGARMPFLAALRKLFARLNRRLRARRYLSAHKNSPEGLYFLLQKICRNTPFAQQPGDTPAEFFERLETAMEAAGSAAAVERAQKNAPGAAASETAQKNAPGADALETAQQNMPGAAVRKHVEQLQEVRRQLNINFYAKTPQECSYAWAGALTKEVKKMARAAKRKPKEPA